MKIQLSEALIELQKKTIGVAKIHGVIHLVTEESKHTFEAINLGTLGGLSTSYFSKAEFQYENFPVEFATLYEFLHEPNQFHNWYREHFQS